MSSQNIDLIWHGWLLLWCGWQGREGWQGMSRTGLEWTRRGRTGQVGRGLHGDQRGNSALFHNWSNHFNLDIQLHFNNICMSMHTDIHVVACIVALLTAAPGHN